MRNPKTYDTLFNEKPKSKPKAAMLFVYLVLAISLCVFGASVWFSSYAKHVFIQRGPIFEAKRSEIQYEIQGLELEENTLTGIERIRKITKELGLVETTKKSKELRDR
jgi:cell division protein FtsL